MPGATETEFFRRADMLDTKVGAAKKDDPAKDGFKAMMAGEGGVVSGWQSRVGGCGSTRDAGREARQEAYRNGGARDGEKIGERAPSFLPTREDAAHPWAQPPFDRCRNKRRPHDVGASIDRSPLPIEPGFSRCSFPDSARQGHVRAHRHGSPSLPKAKVPPHGRKCRAQHYGFAAFP